MTVKLNLFKLSLYGAILLFNTMLRAQTEYIVTVDLATGKSTKIDSIPGIVWLLTGSAYNQATNECTVLGKRDQPDAPAYLYTVNVVSGKTIHQPVIATPNSFIRLQYCSSSGILYGVISAGGMYHLASINKTTGTWTNITDLADMTAVNSFTIDEANHQLFLNGIDKNTFALLTIDLQSGTIARHVQSKSLTGPVFDNGTKKIYAISSRQSPSPASFLCSVDPVTGNTTSIIDLPAAITGIYSDEHTTFDEKNHLYIFLASEQNGKAMLYSMDVATGATVYRAPVSSSAVTDQDNLIFFRHNNISGKTYALLWEAKTITPPPDTTTTPSDSASLSDDPCAVGVTVALFPNPFGNKLVVENKTGACIVLMNLYDALGRQILKGRIVHAGRNEYELDNIAQAMYFYEFTAGGRVISSGRVFKQ